MSIGTTSSRRLKRTGTVSFGDASLSIWEEGMPGKFGLAQEWERCFKREVFLRIVQQLNRLGWSCAVPPDKVKSYGRRYAENSRLCSKGDLHAELDLSGRHIELKMWQSINTPTRPDHGGRYESNKEAIMPYLLRLEMERTRRRIRKYLINIFEGYEPPTKRHDGRSEKRGPGALTAEQWIAATYETSSHFKGDTTAYRISDYNNKSADGGVIQHGERVWGFDHKGRPFTGIAHYNINNMWWVATGKYDVRNEASFRLYVAPPTELRVKRNDKLRRSCLERELNAAISAMDFRRAEIIRDLLWPVKQDLFLVYHCEHECFHCTGFSGYTKDRLAAGKFTLEEVRGWDKAPNKVVPLNPRAVAA